MASLEERINALRESFSQPREQLRRKVLAVVDELDLGLYRGMAISQFESRLRKLSDAKCARLLDILRE